MAVRSSTEVSVTVLASSGNVKRLVAMREAGSNHFDGFKAYLLTHSPYYFDLRVVVSSRPSAS